MSRYGVDPLSVDKSVLAEMPDQIRLEIEAEVSLMDQGASPKNTKEKEPLKKKRKYRQAVETKDNVVELLCFKCRRAPAGSQAQASLTRYFTGSCKAENVCSRCRRPMHTTPSTKTRKNPKQPPQITRLKAYKRISADQGVPFALSDGEALALMRADCFGCGAPGGENGNGISRLRDWTGFDNSKAKKKYMGPFSKINCITACATCNLMKGYRRIPAFVEAARTIATHRAGPNDETFGLYPHRFRNNVSRRSRSAYITLSSTHTKTHCLTNQQFNQIVSQPCAYCGKQSNPPHHYNGLDRLNSEDRVYRVDNVVSSCGTCNIMKYTHSLDFFIAHCRKVAIHHRGVVFPPEVDYDDDEEAAEEPELEPENVELNHGIEVEEDEEETEMSKHTFTNIVFPDIDDDDDDEE